MNKIAERIKIGIEDNGSYVSADFKNFCREFKTAFKRELSIIGGTNYKQCNGHYEISGFFTYEGECYYISLSDVRYFTEDDLLIRSCKDYKDFSGGTNNYIHIEKGMLSKYFN